jgi:PAS domain S-box-containing protein
MEHSKKRNGNSSKNLQGNSLTNSLLGSIIPSLFHNVRQIDVKPEAAKSEEPIRIQPSKALDVKKRNPLVALFKEIPGISNYRILRGTPPVDEDKSFYTREIAETLMAAIGEPALLIDTQFRAGKVNPAFCRMFGVKAKEIEGQVLSQLADGIFDTPAVQTALLSAQPSQQLRLPVMDRKGTPQNIEVTIRQLSDDKNQAYKWLLVIHKLISGQRSSGEKFLGKAIKDPFKIMAENAPVMIWSADPSKGRTYFNPPWLRFTGRTLKQESGNGWIKGIHPDDLERCMKIYNTAFDRRVSFKKEYRLRYHDGSYRWVLSTGVPLIENGVFYGYVGSCTDIHYRVEQEKQKEDFIVAASHELKTPLTIIKIYTELLKETMQKTQQADSIQLSQKLDGQVNRLTWLIKEMLDVSKMAHGSLRLKQESFHMAPLIEEVVEDMQTTTESHRFNKIIDCSELLWGDKEKIRQVLVNLISNAIKYSPGAERIDIIARKTADDIQISVRDYGIGIPLAMQDRIFERFYRAADKENTYPGIGLGLYISSEIIKSHGGKIWFTSIEEKGSEFCFSLPLKGRPT